MTPTTSAQPTTAPVSPSPQASVSPTTAEANPLDTTTGTSVNQTQAANLADVPGIQNVMNSLVAVMNGQQVSVDPRNGQQFVVNLGDRQELGVLIPKSPEGNSSVFALVGTAGQTLATIIVSYDSSTGTHVATVRQGDSPTLTGVTPQDFGTAAPSPDVDRTLTALATAFPPRSSHPDQASLPDGSALRYRADIDGGTFRVIQGEGSETGTHNSTEVIFTPTGGDDIYLQFVRTQSGKFLIQQAYVMPEDRSQGSRRPASSAQINDVMGRLRQALFGRSEPSIVGEAEELES